MGGQLSNIRHDHLWEEELDLAETLKELCDQNGKEKNPKESAIILNQMGVLYKKRSPDRLSLIRSAVLLNAAVARQPDNEAFNKDLDTFCSELLQVSGATQTEADLMELSNAVAEKVKLMRDNTNTSLQSITNLSYDITDDQLKEHKSNLIEEVQSIQNEITESYTNIMKFISANCEEIMGKPPCKYAVTGMGSLARKEITPYSDFEHIILLEEGIQNNKNKYARALNYFRWFSMIFHMIIINLKETIIPCVTIPSLNDPSKPNGYWFFDSNKPRGVSFDGLIPHACKLPLGRMEKTKKKPWTTELIRPVSDMLHYLDFEEDLKNGYKLCDILLKTCFVSGYHEVYKEFADNIVLLPNPRLYRTRRSSSPVIMKQLREDLENFDIFNNLKKLYTSSNCNIKRMVYRTTSLFICALGRLQSIKEASSFSIINCLRDKNVITDETAFQLSYAIAIACLSRLKVYMSKKSQDDYLGQDEFYDLDNNRITIILIDIVGERSIVDYFIISYVLQDEIKRKELSLDTLQLNINIEPRIKFIILRLLCCYEQIINDWELYLQKDLTSLSFDDECSVRFHALFAYYMKQNYERSLIMCEWFKQQQNMDALLKMEVMLNKAWCLYKLSHYQESITCIEEVMQDIYTLNLTEVEKYNQISELSRIKGNCKYSMGLYDEACDEQRKAITYLERSDTTDKEIKIIIRLYSVGWCLYNLGKFKEAINEANRALQFNKPHKVPVNIKCGCYKLLGRCYLGQTEYTNAFQNFQVELKLRLQFVPKEQHALDKKIKEARDNIRMCETKLLDKTG